MCIPPCNNDEGESVEDLKAGVDADAVDVALLASTSSRIMAL
jgi:hypothetical protein